MNLGLLLGYLAIAFFLPYFFFKNGISKYYLLYIVYLFPLMDLKVVPFDYGNFKVFDLVTILALLVSPRILIHKFKWNNANFLLFVIFIVMLVLSSLASDFPKRAILSLVTVCTPFLFAAILYHEISSDTSFARDFIKGLKFTGILALAFIGIQLLIGVKFTFYDMLNQNVWGGPSIRYPGFFMDSQINGIFIAMISPVWLINFDNPGKLTLRHLAGFSLMLGGLILAGSRSPMIGVAASTAFMIFLLRGNLRFQLVRYVALGACFAILLSATTNSFERFTTLDRSLDIRQNIWDGAFDIFKQHPTLGIGMNNYKDYVMKHAQDQSIMLDDNEILYLDAPENGYLKLMVEWGVIAFSLLMIIVSLPLFKLINYYVRGYDVRLATIFGGSIICWFISSMSVHTLSDSRIAILLSLFIVMTTLFTEKEIKFSSTD